LTGRPRAYGHNGRVRFVVIRHGQSSNNLLYEETGDSVGRHHDPELTELGRTQAARLARSVTDGTLPWRITQIHTSLMTRAVQTAAPVADALDIPLLGHLDAYETGGPFIEDADGVRTPHRGATSADLQALTGRLVLPQGAAAEGWYDREYEDADDLATARAQRLIVALRQRHEDEDVVALVTHGAFFQFLFRALLGIEAMTGWVLKHNTAVSLFADEPSTAGATTTAHRIDWMPHLTDDVVSI
jgi:2,3-bisphosphoglycerate-dependent phosphoglycerate mutase